MEHLTGTEMAKMHINYGLGLAMIGFGVVCLIAFTARYFVLYKDYKSVEVANCTVQKSYIYDK